jgi:hypothetical protein
MDERTLKLEARLYAIEYILSNAFAQIYRGFGVPPDAILKSHADCLQQLEKETFQTDPAISDMLAAEIHDAVEQLLQTQQEVLGLRKTEE